MVAAPDEFRDEELFVPRRLLEEAGAEVTIASTRSGRLRGMLGGLAAATRPLDRVRADELDALLIVGGNGAQAHLWNHAGLHGLLREARERGKVIAAICLAPVTLVCAGVVRDGEVAVHRSPASLHELQGRGVRAAEQDLIRAGKVITASGPLHAERWGQAVIAALAN